MARKRKAGKKGLAARGAVAAEASVDKRLVDRAINHLRKLVVAGQVRLTVEAGDYLIDEFYGGIEAARSRDPHKVASLTSLSERSGEFGMTPSTLAYVVPITLAVHDLGIELADNLGISRLRVVAPMRDSAARRLLAETATAAGWTVKKLKERVRKLAKPHAGGRPAQPAVERALTRLERVVDSELGDAARLRQGADTVTARQARAMLARVNRVQEQVERMEKLVQRLATRAQHEGAGG